MAPLCCLMCNNKSSSTVAPTSPSQPPSPTPPVMAQTSPKPLNNKITLIQPCEKKRHKSIKMFKLFRSVFRSFPIITPGCPLPALLKSGPSHSDSHINGTRVTGTLFGYHKGRVSLAIQDGPKCLPDVVIELPMQTNVLLKEMSSGLVRVTLECDKSPDPGKLLDEQVWTMSCNGKKVGFSVRREPTKEDLNVMQLLQAVSMGAGVLPSSANCGSSSSSEGDGQDAEVAYMRSPFERAVGSKDSEAFHMLNPDGSNGPELSIFLVRI